MTRFCVKRIALAENRISSLKILYHKTGSNAVFSGKILIFYNNIHYLKENLLKQQGNDILKTQIS